MRLRVVADEHVPALTYEDRRQNYALSRRGSSQESIADILGVSQSAGAFMSLTRLAGREGAIVVLDTFMRLPPVVVGLANFLTLSRSGPLGSWGLLFTPQVMVIAQAVRPILEMSIIAALTRQMIKELWLEYCDELLDQFSSGTVWDMITWTKLLKETRASMNWFVRIG